MCVINSLFLYVHPLFIHTSCKSISILLAYVSCQPFLDPLLLLFSSFIVSILDPRDSDKCFVYIIPFLGKEKDKKNLSKSSSISCSSFWKQDISCRRKISCDKMMPCFALISYLYLSCPWKL